MWCRNDWIYNWLQNWKISNYQWTGDGISSEVLQILNKIGKITIKGKGDLCPAAVSVSNIIIQNGGLKTEKISVSSEALDDGRLVSTIEIVITKIQS